MHKYIPNTTDDRDEMLKTLGYQTMDQLFSDIPENLKLNRPLDLDGAKSELAIRQVFKNHGLSNRSLEELTCFMGAGAYDHYIPSAVDQITSRQEFFTAYTPYQPEISQGTLRAIFEFQTLICRLTGMDVANASMYDGPTACAEGAILAVEAKKKRRVVVAETVHPEVRQVLKTYCRFKSIDVEEVSMAGGETDYDDLNGKMKGAAAVIVQNPNFFGIVEDVEQVVAIAAEHKALVIDYVDPMSLGILKSPGEQGVDIVVGEGQSLGNPLNFGGPYLGFFAVTKKLVRKIPGRVVGETVDADGARAYVLTLQAREQHIRRFKATSNICSNQALVALRSTVYMSLMGKKGLQEVAEQSYRKAHYAYNRLIETGKFRPVFEKPFFKEFALEYLGDVGHLNAALLENGILGGFETGQHYDMDNVVLMAVTEKRSREEIDQLTQLVEVI